MLWSILKTRVGVPPFSLSLFSEGPHPGASLARKPLHPSQRTSPAIHCPASSSEESHLLISYFLLPPNKDPKPPKVQMLSPEFLPWRDVDLALEEM